MTPTILKFEKPRHRQKLAMLDYDWTLVKPKQGRKFPKDADDWMWLEPNVPEVLKKYYDNGYAIYVFTNQTKAWKENHIKNSLESLKIPMTVVIAYDKEEHKPSRKMFDAVMGDKKWKREDSFFVGDALGRAGDFADTDKLFGEAIGVTVKSPEDLFVNKQTKVVETVTHIKSEPSKKEKEIVKPSKDIEIIVMVGFPGSGKSTLAKKFLEFGYVVIDGDVYKTEKARMKKAIASLESNKSVVFDATNLTREKRKVYLDVARDFMIPMRAIYVESTMEEAYENNQKRLKEKQVPLIAYRKMNKTFQKPTEDEGFELQTIQYKDIIYP